MKTLKSILNHKIIITLLTLSLFNVLYSQTGSDPLKTPLKQDVITMLSNEISGQMIYNNMVSVSGAPWIRDQAEFGSTFYETQRMYDLVKSYGIENVKIERSESNRSFSYPAEAEFWLTSPEKKLVARLGADAALVAGGSRSADFEGELIYIPPVSELDTEEMLKPENREKYNGKIALMWSHAQRDLAKVLDSVGVKAVISFGSRERYVDPDMVVYSSGSYSGFNNLMLGFTISWRQWSELMEDVEYGTGPVVRCMTKIEQKQDKFETVFSWIPGTEPDGKGVIFTAHLFEGYTKRGANDNTGGCVVQLEILRALSSLIESGAIEQPRRSIYFVWPNEISGTYEFISTHPEVIEKSAININMDMVTESLRLNNSLLTMGESPNHLPSFYDGLANSVLNYVWRTNDIVYLNDSPRGRRGGQYLPLPMVEKNGSLDAFRYYIHEATGGSDHICFNNSSVAVPGIEFFTWPDYWYHADKDTPDKGDPTQMKRIAFIGAATAYASANCTDEVLGGIIAEASEYGYSRVAQRELPEALSLVRESEADDLTASLVKALNVISLAGDREIGALESIREIYSGSVFSKSQLDNSIREWELYRNFLVSQVKGTARLRAESFGIKPPAVPAHTKQESKSDKLVPVISHDIKYRIFSPGSLPAYNEYLQNNPDSRAVQIARGRDARSLTNYIDGTRSVTQIWKYVTAETGSEISLDDAAVYFDMLKETGFITYNNF
ncbi:MAG: M28 family peptidase [Bacteroidia bacterium]|nr:MAG: M28 family peptidase [Bacteroidia bacterium]